MVNYDQLDLGVKIKMRFYTPLRYPGGKGKLSYYIKSIVETNSLSDGYYVEPYAGGAAVAIDLLINEYVRYILINDADFAIYSFWHSVINNTEELCSLIDNIDINMQTWNEQKDILKKGDSDPIKMGFAAFFLNRTNRSGILKAGVIGGKDQSGDWKMDARFNKKDLIDRIRKISSYKNRIKVTNMDAIDLITNLKEISNNNKKLFVYLDPPYYIKGQDLYRNFYDHNDHVLVKDALEASEISNWVVSYDNAVQIKKIYSDYRQTEYSLSYTAQLKKVGEEVMIFSDALLIPEQHLGKVA